MSGRALICWMLALRGLAVWGQWVPAGMPGNAMTLQGAYSDPGNDTVYFYGSIQVDTTQQWFESNAVMRYANGQWDTLGVIRGLVNSVVLYRDTLIVAGTFDEVDGLPIERIVAYAGGSWFPYGSFDNGVRKVKMLNDELYAVGGFLTADGDTCYGVAKRMGNLWQGVGEFVPDSWSGLVNIELYDGAVVVIGPATINGIRSVFQYDGLSWSPLGPGILGGLAGLRSIAVFQGDLYVGGQIPLGAGNPGQEIMRWDGSSFHGLGLGLQAELGDFSSFSGCFDMTVHDNKLFVCGGFNYAGGVLAQGVASWDGTQWCGVPGEFTSTNHYANALAFYYDTLFVQCGDTADGQFVNQVAKFVGTDYADTCATVGMLEVNGFGPAMLVYPNPVQVGGSVQVSALPQGTAALQIMDMVGRVLAVKELRSTDSRVELSLADLMPGSYLVGLDGLWSVVVVQP